jgi:hypothetical protein
VYWVWPVKTGIQTRYERVILYMLDTADGRVAISRDAPDVKGVPGALVPGRSVDTRLITIRGFLVAFAREIIRGQTHITEGVTPIGQVLPPSPPPAKQTPVVAPAGSKRPPVPQWLVRFRQIQAAYAARTRGG